VPNPYPVRWQDDSEDAESRALAVRLAGVLTFTDPANQPGGMNQDLSQVLAVGNDAGAQAIAGLADPTNDQDAATKAYVDVHAGAVSSVFGRTGAVVAVSGDYDVSEISGTLGGDLAGTLPDPTLAAGAAAGNVGALGGDLDGTLPGPTLAAIISPATKGDATHSAVVVVDAKGRVTSLTEVAIAGTAPGGSAGGDLTGTYPNPTLIATGPGPITVGSAVLVPIITVDAKGRVTALTTGAPAIDTIGGGTNITTNDVSTTKHGLAPKLPNDATKYLDGTGAYSVPAGGGGGAMALICSQVLATAQATFDTNTILGGSIPGTYHHLKLVLIARGDTLATSTNVLLTFNADTGAHYDFEGFQASGTTVAAFQNLALTNAFLANMASGSAAAGLASQTSVEIAGYAGTAFQKTFITQNGMERATTTGNLFAVYGTGYWRSTAAITRITLTPAAGNFDVGSAFYLYGIT
jgi:hypothetical protein